MAIEEALVLTEHDLGDGLVFRSGRLPESLLWDSSTFEAAWTAHPTEKHEILMHGRPVETPRWQQAYGADYHYTGRVNRALPVPPVIEPLMAWVQSQVDPRINGALLNWYEGPGHYIGPHHDSVKHMVVGAPIVTVSFGETRTFRLTRGKGRGRGGARLPRAERDRLHHALRHQPGVEARRSEVHAVCRTANLGDVPGLREGLGRLISPGGMDDGWRRFGRLAQNPQPKKSEATGSTPSLPTPAPSLTPSRVSQPRPGS